MCRAGFQPIATCSPANNDNLRKLGAVATFDYHSPTCGMDIRTYTQNTLAHVLDCVTSTETMSMCYEAIGSAGGRYLGLDPISTQVAYTRRDVYANWIVAVTLFGVPIKFAGVYGRPAMPEHRQISARVYRLAEDVIKQGNLVGPSFQVRSGGLAAVEEGIEEIRKGRVRGGKLVYTLT
jgi:aspyridone synthetase trans-acting enoyl reductase